MNILKEKTIKTENIYKGKVIDFNIETVVLPNGKQAKRELVNHHGGVGVLPIDENYNAYIVKQFRSPYKEIVSEIPAGKLEKNEEHLICGKRELLEETGFVSDNMQFLGEIYPTPGYTNEHLYLYLATSLRKETQKLDEDEFLNVEKIPFEELYEKCMNGEIKDAKTVITVLKAKIILKK